eukprot:TRINITY_DN5071_c0_g1_i1.p1 TRINITY_DN5071_c0_g1~~TRINITY_DN5071_c0_g1_i1.p1  ORF type:complete len:271 (-),score=59.99 TRINITY_DN5071_c0_g1_i1:131-943(-)
MSDDIFTAAQTNNVKRLEEFIQDGADINERDWDRGNTPLHWASASGHLDSIEVLLEYGADVNISNKHGRTPLHVLISERFDKIALWLIQFHNADPYIQDKRGVAAYDLAQKFFQPEIDLAVANRAKPADGDQADDGPVPDDDQPPPVDDAVERETMKVVTKRGGFRLIEVFAFDTASDVILKFLDKVGWPHQYLRYLDLCEVVIKIVGTKRYKKEKRIDPQTVVWDVREQWPLTVNKDGSKSSNENCFLLLNTLPDAPTKVFTSYENLTN